MECPFARGWLIYLLDCRAQDLNCSYVQPLNCYHLVLDTLGLLSNP